MWPIPLLILVHLDKRDMNNYSLIAFLATASILQGCASIQMVSIEYEPTVPVTPVCDLIQPVKLGVFDDARGTDSRWVGVVRGGYGNILYRLASDEPTSEVIRKAMAKALSSRSVIISSNAAALTVEGEIVKLDCNYFFNREAHAHILVKVVSSIDRTTIYTHTYRTDNTEPGIGAGVFCDIEYLANFLKNTVNETIDKACSDPAFIEALQWNKSMQSKLTDETDKRLLNLESIRSKKLITENEYKTKRQQILDEL